MKTTWMLAAILAATSAAAAAPVAPAAPATRPAAPPEPAALRAVSATPGAPAPNIGAGATPAQKVGLDPRDVAITNPDVAMRRYMAAVLGEQTDAHSLVLLMILALDGDVEVRQATLGAMYEKRCKRETDALCTELLAVFMRDNERDIAWQARDWLLDRDLELALEDADKEYKLDLLAKLGGSPVVPAGSARHLLRCLTADTDADIQENAAWLLEQAP